MGVLCLYVGGRVGALLRGLFCGFYLAWGCFFFLKIYSLLCVFYGTNSCFETSHEITEKHTTVGGKVLNEKQNQ